MINARTDVFLVGGEFDDAVERARAYRPPALTSCSSRA